MAASMEPGCCVWQAASAKGQPAAYRLGCAHGCACVGVPQHGASSMQCAAVCMWSIEPHAGLSKASLHRGRPAPPPGVQHAGCAAHLRPRSITTACTCRARMHAASTRVAAFRATRLRPSTHVRQRCPRGRKELSAHVQVHDRRGRVLRHRRWASRSVLELYEAEGRCTVAREQLGRDLRKVPSSAGLEGVLLGRDHSLQDRASFSTSWIHHAHDLPRLT